jgi:S1-C subfamily serine protease
MWTSSRKPSTDPQAAGASPAAMARPGRLALRAASLRTAICILSLGVCPAISAAQTSAESRPVQLTAGEVFARASASVVTIITPSAQGSGVLIDTTGIVVTNFHVIRNETTATVRLASGEAYDDIRVVDVDPRRDLAVLKIKGGGFRSVQLGDSDKLEVGDPVYTIGSPLGLAQSLSQGIVSAKRWANGYLELQTTAPISHGSSGGGLFDAAGRLVGLTYRMRDGENLNFAVPSNYLHPLLEARGTYSLAELRSKVQPQVAHFDSTAGVFDSVPRLSNVYNDATGNQAVIEQRGGSLLRVTFASPGLAIYGHAELSWNPDLEAFDGSAAVNVKCDGFPSRTGEGLIKFQQLFVVNESIIRMRWLNPDKLDCATGTVEAFSWQESLWVLPR